MTAPPFDTPSGVLIGDFNNDGKVDIATANNAASTVSIRRGDGYADLSYVFEAVAELERKGLAYAAGGNVFGLTRGLRDRFGDRVRDTPISETAIVGAAGEIVWFDDEPLLPGRPYLLKLGTRTVQAQVAEPKYKINVNSLERLAATRLELNEIGVCNLSLDAAIAFDPYADNRELGAFIPHRTVGWARGRGGAFAERMADSSESASRATSMSSASLTPPPETRSGPISIWAA